MVSYKRSASKKRTKSRSRRPLAKGSSTRSRAKVVKGYTRKSGMYGRFGPMKNKPEAKFSDVTYNQMVQTVGPDANVPVGTLGFTPMANTASYNWGVIYAVPIANQATATAIFNTGLCRDYPLLKVDHLLQIPQGPGATERIGRKVFLKTINFHGSMQYHDGHTGQYRMHLWVVQDTQCNGQAPATTDIWQPHFNSAGAVANVVYFDSHMNLANSGRFKILKHKKIDLATKWGTAKPDGTVQDAGDVLQEFTFALAPKIAVEFASNAVEGTLLQLRSDSLILFYSLEYAGISSVDPVANNFNVLLTLRSRLRFTDL